MREGDRTEIFLETMGRSGQESGATPLKSCNRRFEMKNAGSGVFINGGYYRDSTRVGVKEMIRSFEGIRTSAGERYSKGEGLGQPEKSKMTGYVTRSRTETYESPRKSRCIHHEDLVQPTDSSRTLTPRRGSRRSQTTPSRRGRWARSAPSSGQAGGAPRPSGPAWGGGSQAAPRSTGSLGQASLAGLLLL